MSMVYVLVWPGFVTSGAEGSMDPLSGKRGKRGKEKGDRPKSKTEKES